ncbi:MAG TPA: carboxypeptidase-like regulatory domain-containing protein, partial [Vicinamibacterales bacterium]|nr:carboxypeptidase-like regulatory domain-containing protein [Vicinamibacterales bacterium]
MRSLKILVELAMVFGIVAPAAAQITTSGVIVDQTGLPLPGVQIEVKRGNEVVAALVSGADGTFSIPSANPDDIVNVTLDGFEPAHVPVSRAARIVLEVAHATESTTVVASVLTSSGAAMETLGSRMTAQLAQRLPEPRPRILQSLPLLPSVVRGTDGLLRIGGTRPHESSLWIDGFDVTDPVTLTSAIDLPNESVKGMAVLREPTAATFSGALGSIASIETVPGGDKFNAGIQGFIPRPRLNSAYGLGRIEAFFPRAYASGKFGKLHYFASTEFNFERVPVPGVTDRSGSPSTGATGTSSFVRFDLPLSATNTLTFEGILAPANATAVGLSTLTELAAAPNIANRDLFGGVVDHIVLGANSLLTLRFGLGEHRTEVQSSGRDTAILSPDGWHQNFFAEVADSGVRRAASITLDRTGLVAAGTHTLSFSADVRGRSMSGAIETHPIEIQDDQGRTMRFINTAQVPSLTANDTTTGFGVRDLWEPFKRVQIDLNVRADFPTFEPAALSPRLAAAYAVDDNGRTTIKGSIGRFVGRVPLGALGFDQLGSRFDVSFVPGTGFVRRFFRPALGRVYLPHADMMSIELEHRILPTLEFQTAFRRRVGYEQPTVEVPPLGGSATLASTGTSTYNEFAVSVRQTWRADRELFVSYVRSSSTGDVNDYGTLITNLDAPLFEPAGQAPTTTDTPHRLRSWATFQFPHEIVISPAVEWRTGFPYSLYDIYRHYVGEPNSQRFPNYFSLDVTAF